MLFVDKTQYKHCLVGGGGRECLLTRPLSKNCGGYSLSWRMFGNAQIFLQIAGNKKALGAVYYGAYNKWKNPSG